MGVFSRFLNCASGTKSRNTLGVHLPMESVSSLLSCKHVKIHTHLRKVTQILESLLSLHLKKVKANNTLAEQTHLTFLPYTGISFTLKVCFNESEL